MCVCVCVCFVEFAGTMLEILRLEDGRQRGQTTIRFVQADAGLERQTKEG